MSIKPALDIIKEFEGLKLKAYLCPAKVWTIGFGTTVYPDGKPVRKGDVITAAQAEEYLIGYVEDECFRTIRKYVKARMNINEVCALISFCYNIGNGAFANSTLVRKLNAGTPRTEVAAQFGRWTRGGGKVLPGLVRRRAMEKALFLKAVL